MTFREIIACVLLQRILRHCKTPHYTKCHMAILNRDPTPNNENQATTRHNEQSDKKGGCFHRHRKVWRILSDGGLDFVPQQWRVSARRNVILNSVWWLTWIDLKGCEHCLSPHDYCPCGLWSYMCKSRFEALLDQDQNVSPHNQRKGSLLSITQQWLTQPASVATFSCEWNSWFVTTVRLVVPGKGFHHQVQSGTQGSEWVDKLCVKGRFRHLGLVSSHSEKEQREGSSRKP